MLVEQQSPIEESATIYLSPCADSHPFTDRCISVPRVPSLSSSSAVRIGRASGQLRPAKDNGLFDCKVLSRCHALLGYSIDGSFLLSDTRSSNGTFVNGVRLERNRPCSLCSGDVIQLGVPVRCRDKPVFACVKARIVDLRHPDGQPAIASRASLRQRRRQQQRNRYHGDDSEEDEGEGVGQTELLARCLERAMQRERLLDLKLACLRRRQLRRQQQRRGTSSSSLMTDESSLADSDDSSADSGRLRLTWRRLSADSQAVARLKSLAADAAEVDISGGLAEISDAATDAWLAELDRGLAERQAMIGRLADLEAQLDLGGRECQHLLARCDQIAGMLAASSTSSNSTEHQHQRGDIVGVAAAAVANGGSGSPAVVDTLAVGVQISLVEELLDYVLDKTGLCLDAVVGNSRPVDDAADIETAALGDVNDDESDGATLRHVIKRHHRSSRRRDVDDEDEDRRQLDDDVDDAADIDDLEAGRDYRLSESLLATERRVAELISRLDAEQRRYLASGAELGESAQQLLDEMRRQAQWLDDSLKCSGDSVGQENELPGTLQADYVSSLKKDSTETAVNPDCFSADWWRILLGGVLLNELASVSALVLLFSLTIYLLLYWF